MLFAQTSQAVSATTPTWLFVVLGVTVVAVIMLILLVVISFRYAHTSRQLQHTERLKAIEAGMPLEDADAMKAHTKYLHNTFWISLWLGFGVPATAFWGASAATNSITGNLGLGIAIWSSAAVASLGAVICATVLMVFSWTRQSDRVQDNPKLPVKS